MIKHSVWQSKTILGLSLGLMAVLSAACGNQGGSGATAGNNDPATGATTKASFRNVYSFGDSLSDTGTFNIAKGVQRFTVNGTGSKVWVELLAEKYGITGPCNYYTITTSIATNTG